jgi:hypothetical protein
MPIEIAKIEELAPDQASLSAAAKLRKATAWSLIAGDGGGLIWGECQGSGASPYRVICSETDFATKCTCPSRKFPCKHALALMWMRAEGALPFADAPQPDWVGDWLARRRPGTGAQRKPAPQTEARASAAEAVETEPVAEDPKAAARAAAQRERNRAERETSILGGLEELDIWITDAVQGGLAAFMPAAQERCRKIAQRLVDAKATGVAGMVERLPADLAAVPEPLRPEALIERLGALHLIARAYRNQDRLPAAAKADIRQLIGWPVTREALLADADALRLRDRWMVVATIDEVQADKLRRLETWLSRLGEGAAPRFAVLMDFVPVSTGKVTNTYGVGEAFEAELAYFPSPTPLRAIVAERSGATTAGERWPRPADDVEGAVARLGVNLALRPWTRDMPFAAHGARIVAAGASLWLTDAAGNTGLPLRADEDDLALPLTYVEEIDAFGRWDGHFLSLHLCETALGRWSAA